MKFLCSECGACCKRTIALKILKLPCDEYGTCVFLKNNKCSIYNSRPDVCNVDKVYKRKKKEDNSLTKKQLENLLK